MCSFDGYVEKLSYSRLTSRTSFGAPGNVRVLRIAAHCSSQCLTQGDHLWPPFFQFLTTNLKVPALTDVEIYITRPLHLGDLCLTISA